MQYKKFILSSLDNGAEEEELNRFLRGHRVLKVDEKYVSDGAYWAILVSYMENEVGGSVSSGNGKNRNDREKRNPETELTPEQLVRYKVFADVRLQIARRENMKAFVVFTNNELIEIAKIEELTVGKIAKISGIGEKRASQYGEELVDALAAMPETITEDSSNEESGQLDAADSLRLALQFVLLWWRYTALR